MSSMDFAIYDLLIAPQVIKDPTTRQNCRHLRIVNIKKITASLAER